LKLLLASRIVGGVLNGFLPPTLLCDPHLKVLQFSLPRLAFNFVLPLQPGFATSFRSGNAALSFGDGFCLRLLTLVLGRPFLFALPTFSLIEFVGCPSLFPFLVR
jgi:hypothetical protein